MKILKKGSHGPQVKLLQHWLNKLFLWFPALKETGKFDGTTEAAVILFKMRYGIRPFNGEVDQVTLAAVGTMLGTRASDGEVFGLPIRQLIDNFFGPLNINQSDFIEGYVQQFGLPTENDLDGLSALLRFIDLDPFIDDVRWAAYMLATVFHECRSRSSQWQPIEEGGKGKGHSYGRHVRVLDSDGHPHMNAYYGRGYVQLTHKDNYQIFDNVLQMGGQLVSNPELALEPTTAYAIMSIGMREGGFIGRKGPNGLGGDKLGDYINGTKRDYYNARNIINTHHDKALEIEGYALKFEALLRASVH